MPDPDKFTRWRMDCAALAIAPVTILIQGHNFGLGNHDTLISFIRRILNPQYLANDWMLSTPPVHPQLLHVVALLVRVLGEPLTFLLLQFGTRVLLLMGVWRLVESLLRPPAAGDETARAPFGGGWEWIAIVAMIGTVLEPRLRLGAHYLQGGHWEPAFSGMAMAVWIMALSIRASVGRDGWVALGIAGGAGIFLHLFINLPVFAVTWLAAAVMARQCPKALLTPAIALLLGAPSLFPAALNFFHPGEAPLSPGEVIAILQARHPHHHQPWTWPASHYCMAVILFTVAGISAWKLFGRMGTLDRLFVPAGLFVYFILSCTLFWVFGVSQDVAILAYLQPFRLISLFILLAQIMVIVGVFRIFGRAPVLALIALLVMRMTGFYGPIVMAACLLVTVNWKRDYALTPDRRLPSIRNWLMVLFAGLIGVVLLQTVQPLRATANRIRPQHWLVNVEPVDVSRAQLVQWIHENTPEDALFAIDPALPNFRLWEQRAIVVDHKNIPYENRYMKEWAARMKLATPETMNALAKEFGADYIVLNEDRDDDLYPGSGFAVYRVNAESQP